MRSIEIFLVIVIITAAFIIASFFAVLPSPRQVSPLNLRRLALTTLQTLDGSYDLSRTVFALPDDPVWGELQIALSACLPPNIVYNMSVYEVMEGGSVLYTLRKSIVNADNLGTTSDSASCLVASNNVTFRVTPEKIGQGAGGGGTLYILNCSDAHGWWITGYTSQSLAEDFYNLLSPYFENTVMVQNTQELGTLLNGTSLQGEPVGNAVVVNTVGEAVPIPSGYYASNGVGYDVSQGSYARYCYTLGQRVLEYNWTWTSIVGYPVYYVANTGLFPTEQNDYGIYGMRSVGPAGLNAFLRGIDNETYSYNNNWITGSPGLSYLSDQAEYYRDYYGIYPSEYQTFTRALPTTILNPYHLVPATYVFNPVVDGGSTWLPGTILRHTVTVGGTTNYQGALFALGVTRTPDIRVTALGILSDYKPRLYRSEYDASASRFIILQLGQTGGY
jgi:hypothetical protein